MPIYAYRCATCGHAQDVLQKMSDPLLSVCPACGAATFVKQVTAAGFQLKGSGWYVTDFKGGGAPKPQAEAAPAEGDANAKKDANAATDAGNKPDAASSGPSTATAPTSASAPGAAAPKSASTTPAAAPASAASKPKPDVK